jgi:SPX domain protein involved in polyphosphate accumulation
MSNLSHVVRSFNRFELKYLLSLQQAELVKTSLRAYLIADEHGNGNGRYPLTSLYYDSPDYRCYWEKVDGVKFRRKLRIRCYDECQSLTEDSPVFVEIKQRVSRVTQKRRAVLPYAAALQLCNDRLLPEHDSQDKAVVDEIHSFLWQYNLRPTSIVRYERAALIGTDLDLGLRVTFDTKLTCQLNPLRLDEPPTGVPMLSPGQVVMEIKANERVPYWLTELVAAHNLKMVRMSKYCRSIEIASPFLSTCVNPLSSAQLEALRVS